MSSTRALGATLRRVDVRLATALTFVLGSLLAVTLVFVYAYSAEESAEEIDVRVALRLKEAALYLNGTYGPEAGTVVDRQSIDRIAKLEGIALRLLDADGLPLQAWGTWPSKGRAFVEGHHADAEIVAPLPDDERGLEMALAGSEDYVLHEVSLPDGRRLQGAGRLEHFAAELDELKWILGVCFLIGTVLAGAASLALARWAHGPLRRATSAIAQVSANQLNARMPTRGTNDDVDRHATTVNEVLDRIESGVARLERFSADVAHELRTPANRILNVTEVALLSAPDNPAREEALVTAHATAQAMDGLIESLLLISRAEEGRLSVSANEIQLDELISGLVDLYAATCSEREINICCSLTATRISGDPVLISRALGNLLDNAVQHTQDGGEITIESSRTAESVTVSVSDSGPGIPQRERERVFDRFVRLDPARSGPGTGLGLSVVRMVARLHRGNVAISPSSAGGAKFDLTLAQ